MKKQVSIMMIMLILLGILPLAINIRSVKANPATIYVWAGNTSGPWDGTSQHPYRNITSGLAHASAGDTIFVRMGNYRENVIVNKSVRLIGEKPQNTVINGTSTGSPETSTRVHIAAGGCTLENFTITNGGWDGTGGLMISSNNNVVRNNIVSNNHDDGVWIESSTNNTVTNNTITSHTGSNIVLMSSFNNVISNNIIRGSTGGWGIYMHSNSSGNNISNNAISLTQENEGIIVELNSNNNIITRNSITSNLNGIAVQSSSGNLITDNTISYSFRKKIYDEYEGGSGIIFWASSGNSIVNNRLVRNKLDGVSLDGGSNSNFIYHNNFVGNTYSVSSSGAVNVWDNGYPSAGNYWSDYAGVDSKKGPYQNVTGSDGVGDTAKIIDSSNRDRYPLKNPFPSIHAVAVTNVTSRKTAIGQGFATNLLVTVVDNGHFNETVNLITYANGSQTATQIVNLTPSTITTTTLIWNTAGFAYGNYILSAYATPVLGEAWTVDNTKTGGTVMVTIPGDVNGDRTVNGTDANLLSTYFGRPDLFPNGDINNDGAINVLDAIILSQNYGSSW